LLWEKKEAYLTGGRRPLSSERCRFEKKKKKKKYEKRGSA